MKYQTEKAIEILSSTPSTLKALLGDLSDEWVLVANDSETWSPFDVMGHLIHGEETDWIPRAKIILDQGQSIDFVQFDRFAQFENSRGKTMSNLLNEFEKLRWQNIEVLKLINPTKEQLRLKGIHPELGEVTLEQLFSTWVVHDLTHIRQISIELAKKYSENVGVWREYLTILQ